MDIIRTLKEIQYLKLEIKYTEEKLNELDDRKTSIKSTNDIGISPGSHTSNPNSDRFLDAMIAIDKYKETLKNDLNRAYELEREVTDKITALDPKKRIIIKLHYFEGEPIEYICGIIGYSFRHTRRMHMEALEELKKLA